jgi:hypothetical protein
VAARASATWICQLRTRSRRVAGLADEPTKLLDLVNVRLSAALIARFADGARTVIACGLSAAKPFDQAAKQCDVSPLARDR